VAAQENQRTESGGPQDQKVVEQLASEAARLHAIAEQLAAQRTLSPEAAALAERLRESAEQIVALLGPPVERDGDE